MKAPDKIYLAESDNIMGEVISNFASSTPFRIHSSIAYIRKDALLEYLTGRKKELLSGESFVSGERKMLKEIIEKMKRS